MEKNKIRFGLIGTNFITNHIINGGLHDKRFEVAAIYSRTQEKGQEFADKHNIPTVYTNLEKMVSSPDIDAVYIASPNSCHAPQSILCMENGKHVLCEKPLAGDLREAQLMHKVARENNVVFMEAMKTTPQPNFKSILANLNKIGRIRKYFASYCQYSSRYNLFKQGIIENAFNPELSNGALVDIGIYTIWPMVRLFGKPNSTKATGILLPTGVDAEGAAIFAYDDMDATVIYSKVSDSFLPSEIQGEDGSIIIEKINTFQNVYIKYRNGETESINYPQITDDYYYEISEFIDLIVDNKYDSKINPIQTSLDVIEIMDEIRKQIGVTYPCDSVE